MDFSWKDKRQLSPKPIGDGKESLLLATDLIVEIDEKQIEVFVPVWQTYELFLSIAEKCGNKAKEYDNKLFDIVREKNSQEDVTQHILIEPTESYIVYDVFECYVQMVVFSVIALEAFANRMIPNNYRKGKKDKKSIERYEKLKDKFLKILPQIYNFQQPINEEWWKDFEFMIEVRDDIVHYKHNNPVDYIQNMYKMFRLAQKKPIPEIAREIIEYYLSRCDIEKYKQKKNPSF